MAGGCTRGGPAVGGRGWVLVACGGDDGSTATVPPPTTAVHAASGPLIQGDDPGGPWLLTMEVAGEDGFRWAVPVGEGPGVVSRLVLDGDTLYGQWGTCQTPTTSPSGLVAFDATTGVQRWRTAALFEGEAPAPRSPASALGGIVVAVSGPFGFGGPVELVGVDAASGAERWRTELRNDGYPDAAALDGPVLVVAVMGPDGRRNQLVAVERATGRVLWSEEVERSGWVDSLVVDHRSGVVVVPDDDPVTGAGSLSAFDLRTGERRWKLPHLVLQAGGSATGGVVVASEVVAGSLRGLVGLDGRDGRERWRRADRGMARFGQWGGRVVVDPDLLDEATGEDVWSAPAESQIISAGAGGGIYSDGQGGLFAFGPDGEELGTVQGFPYDGDPALFEALVAPDGRVFHRRSCPHG